MMSDTANAGRKLTEILRWIARVLLILWAAFWLYFNIGSIFYWLGEQGPSGTVVHIAMVGVIVVLLLAAWLFELVGGILLVLFALATFYQWGVHRPLVMLTLCLPPLIIGVLLITCWLRSHGGKAAGRVES